jgi:hypothetical protein
LFSPFAEGINMRASPLVVAIFALASQAYGFSSLSFSSVRFRRRQAATARNADAASITKTGDGETVSELRVPLSWDEMIRQVSSAVLDATRSDGAGENGRRAATRLVARVLLPRDAASGELGRAVENSGLGSNAVLSPIDESWQGGIMQLYRSAAPTASALLRRLASATAGAGVPPRVAEDRSVDESGVDGVGLFTTSDSKYCVWVQPTQENVDEICLRAARAPEGQVHLLLNPQWRLVDDALDVASMGTGPLAGLANFLGGKGRSLQKLDDAEFVPVYTLEGYVCRGSNVRLLQVRGSPWHVFCERDDRESFLLLGTLPVRPTYQQVDELLDRANVGFKYARDIGLSPKL